jgi:ATP-binding cassette subfamily B protein
VRRVALRGAQDFPRRVAGAVLPHWRLIRMLPSVSPGLAAVVAGGVVLAAALPVWSTFATGTLVGSVPAAVAAGADSPEAWGAFGALARVGVLFVAARAVGMVRATVAGHLGRRVDERLRERVMLALNRPIGIAHLEAPALRDSMERAQGVMGGITAGGTVAPLANHASLWLESAGSALVLAAFSAPLAVALFVVRAISSHYLRVEYMRAIETRSDVVKRRRRADYLRDLALVPGAGKEVRLWGLLDWLSDRYAAEMDRLIGPMAHDRRRGDLVHGTASIAGQVATFVAVAAVGLAAVRGELDLRLLATYLGAINGVGAVAMWGDLWHIAHGTAAMPAVGELERATAAVERHETLNGTTPPDGMPREGISLEQVGFRYAGGETDVLKDLTLFIPAGRSLAIVGANGAGKTTLVKLIARLYDPTAGRITVDGVPLTELDARGWQRRVSAVFQDYIQYHLSARDNVTFGAVERAGDETALLDAARRSGALEVVEKLPHGWETRLSRQYTGGADISGGQWQRLALARALFAVSGGAAVLILDEPTANLDVRAEAALYDRFLDITRGLTTIVISHRFSTVRRADRIVVLDGGGVAEAGTHDELMALGGRYATMFTLQAARFVDDVENVDNGGGGSGAETANGGRAPRA